MSPSEHNEDLQVEKLRLEVAELRNSASLEKERRTLEVQDLKNRVGFWGRLSTVLWPIIGSLLTAVLGLLTWFISRQQARLAERMDKVEISNKHREALDRAISAATDNSNDVDRRIAGIWELAGFWSNADDEGVVANTLASELLLSGDKYRFARCAAAEAIGAGIQGESSFHGGRNEDRSRRIARQLYGGSDGTLGVVSTANVFLNRLPKKTNEQEEIAEHCVTPLAASKEAIRKNWEYYT